jgi:predicted ATP-dependent endonuclease of OLD family
MHIYKLKLQNFRRLKNVLIDFASDISIFVGANNSGKTSTSHALQLFTSASKERFSIHDFSVDTWAQMESFGDGVDGQSLPKISLDIWFHVDANEVHRVIDLLPNLDWAGSIVGLRVQFAASDETTTLANFREAYREARAAERQDSEVQEYDPQPRNMLDYLSGNLRKEYDLSYFVLDITRFGEDYAEVDGYEPLPIFPDSKRTGKHILASLMRVDCLHAQRHLSDSAGGVRAEDLSRCLSRFYDRNLEKREKDYITMRALTEAESSFNEHLGRVFGPTLEKLSELGYPGIANPQLVIKSTLDPASVMTTAEGARVHYALNGSADNSMTLPDRYNGLGFKNLIYMVVELLDIHNQWLDVIEDRPPLHLIFIEEPEAHLHSQLQQVFIRKVLDIIELDAADRQYYSSQVIVTTHSPHILYERGFRPVRYFKRNLDVVNHTSEVLSMSAFYDATDPFTRDFLERYMRFIFC